jgi:Na+-driven multidrug efflux pump
VSTKAFFVGKELGANNFKQAYINDCRINMYAFIFGLLNCLFVIGLAFVIPFIYVNVDSNHKLQTTFCIIAVAFSYVPIIVGISFSSSLNVGGKALQKFLATSIQPFILEVICLYLILKYTNGSLDF